ncbi:hypothetical protein M5689_006351 [Euphorbia peplus]|nr:hypothetical protein M5689_006351 [Euphorbia peplus]
MEASTAPPSSTPSFDPTTYMMVPSSKLASSGPVLDEICVDSIEMQMRISLARLAKWLQTQWVPLRRKY